MKKKYNSKAGRMFLNSSLDFLFFFQPSCASLLVKTEDLCIAKVLQAIDTRFSLANIHPLHIEGPECV